MSIIRHNEKGANMAPFSFKIRATTIPTHIDCKPIHGRYKDDTFFLVTEP
jgi:hypothetical protein